MWRWFIWGFMLFLVFQIFDADDSVSQTNLSSIGNSVFDDSFSQTNLSSIGNSVFDDSFGCIVEAIYFEGRSESDAGQRLIAWSIINRSVIKQWSICRVVQYPMQYSYRNCIDPITQSPISAKYWDAIPDKVCPILRMDDGDSLAKAKRIATEVINEYESNGLVENVTHYHRVELGGARYGGTNERIIGAHVFYDAADAL